ncbi:hypothetical protein PC121_g21676 [Phytophthora cactorum]|nr:hypothetical protein PC120_g23536 [Phytophthora cactorum]KAG3044820.1 hypothetical protein PC121_g21676 [Phytophthora cactorum]
MYRPSKDENLALFSCLAGYEDAMECKVTVNGREWNARISRYIAYVAHKVIIYETLTVNRLSNSTSYPSILFIEEPTHELGTFSAEKIGAKLLAFETGLTVTVTLHHPSTHFYGPFGMLHLRRGCIVSIRW